MLHYQQIFANAAANAAAAVVADNSQSSKGETAKRSGSTKPPADPDKLDYALSKGIKTLQVRLQMQEKQKADKAVKTTKVYKKKSEANSTFAEVQEDPSVMGVRDKMVHKKWTSLDRCYQWQLIKEFVEGQASTGHDLEYLHNLIKCGTLPATGIVYNQKEAKITEINIKPPAVV